MRLIIVRHGDPDYENDCLTELGHYQAELVAKRLMDEGIQEIYSSPQGRARETAEHFVALSGVGPIKILDFMHEIRYGWEGALYQAGKPNIMYYTELLDAIGYVAAECVMVGNDVSEDMCATEVGIKTFLLTDCMINSKNADISSFEKGGYPELERFLFGL